MKMRRNPHRGTEFQRLAEGVIPEPPPPPRIRDSWLTLVFGLLGIFLGILVIILNEAKAVATSKALEESVAAVKDINPYEEIDSSVMGKLIYLCGTITVHEPVTDPEYGISIPAVKLKRRVQMLQWIEEEMKESVNGELPTSRFFYFKDWRDKVVNSALFASSATHTNPRDFPIKTQVLVNDRITVGKYELGTELKEKFNKFVEITSDERPENKEVKLHSGLYYHAQDIWNPEVGDLRIQFSYAGTHGQVISIIGKIDKSNRIVPYKTNLGMNMLLMRLGDVPKEEIFAQEESLNRFLTWVYRGLAWFLLYIGSFCMSHIFRILCQQSGAYPEAVPSMKMSMSLSIFLLVTAFAWIWYRPSLGIALVAAVFVVMYMAGVFCDPHTYALQAAEAIRAAHAAQASQAARATRTVHTTNRYNRL